MDENIFRWGLLSILLLNLVISAIYRRRARQQSGTIPRSAESRGLVLLRLAVVVPLLFVLLGYLLAPGWEGWPRLPLAHWVRLAGWVVGLLCAVFNYWILKTLGRNISETVLVKPEHQLVTDGPYRWVRHPLYANGLLLCVAMVIVSANALLLGFLLIFTGLLVGIIIPREEAQLIARFGDDYRELQRRTGSLLPRLLTGG